MNVPDRELVEVVRLSAKKLGISWQDLEDRLQIPGLQSRLSHGPSCLKFDEYVRLLRWAYPHRTVEPSTVAVVCGRIVHRVAASRYRYDQDPSPHAYAVCGKWTTGKLHDPTRPAHFRLPRCPLCAQALDNLREQEES